MSSEEFPSSLDVLLAQMILSGSVLHFPPRCSHFQLNVALERGASLSYDAGFHQLPMTVDSGHPTHFESCGAFAIRVPDPDMVLHFVYPLLMLKFVWEDIINPLTLTWYLCIMLAGAEKGETLFLGVTLCQYTPSCTMLCFLAAMVFMVL